MANLLIEIAILLFSLAVLMLSTERLIDSAAKLARAFGVSDAVVGLTLLAYGTSLPELAVSSISSLGSHNELSISNILGSNIANIALVIGLAAFIRPFTIKETQLVRRDNYIMVISTMALVALFFFSGEINRAVGAVMIISIVIYTIYTLKYDIIHNDLKKDENISKSKESGVVLAGLLIVIASGKLAVDSAVDLAVHLQVSEWLIGATIVALGTSLPELAVSITAAKKGFFGMSVGNIVGSNIFNILWVLGFAASIHTLSLDFSMIKLDSIFLLTVTFLFAYHLTRKKVSRSAGILYMALYSGYVAYLLTY